MNTHVIHKSKATISVRGAFLVVDADGQDRTPKKRKERGLLALLALSPQRRRSRAWIKDMLWSDRDPDQSAVSLRRALCDLRACLGPAKVELLSDRNEIWLGDGILVKDDPALSGQAELLETLDVPDPQFDEWLRDIRIADANIPVAVGQRSASLPIAKNTQTLVVISVETQASVSEHIFLTSFLTDTLSSRLMSENHVEVVVGAEPSRKQMEASETVLRLEIASVVTNGSWHIHLRAFADRARRFIWSGRATLPMDFQQICEGPEVASFVSTALSNIRLKYQSYKLASQSNYVMLQRATQRLFSSDREQFALAEAELLDVMSKDTAGIALAWRAFGRLTQVLELGLNPRDHLEETRVMLAEAQLRSPGNPLVLGLSSHIELKMMGDTDRGLFLANAGLQSCDQNPYAMLALSQAYFHTGDFEAAQNTAQMGQRMASGMPNAFFWDMQSCLTALGVSDFEAARDAAAHALAQNPAYRPALRYLTAFSLISDAPAKAQHYANVLRQREPEFEMTDLLRADYPMHTLRQTSMADTLRTKIMADWDR